jgi:hypothetical protein
MYDNTQDESFDYNPQDKTDAPASNTVAGEYPYKVDDIQKTTFKSGNKGWKAVLLVGALPDKDVTVYCNFVQTPKALWKFAEFCQSLGLDFDAKPQGGWKPEAFLNRNGRALFKKPDKFLEVDTFLPAKASNGPDARAPRTAQKAALAVSKEAQDGDVPF